MSSSFSAAAAAAVEGSAVELAAALSDGALARGALAAALAENEALGLRLACAVAELAEEVQLGPAWGLSPRVLNLSGEARGGGQTNYTGIDPKQGKQHTGSRDRGVILWLAIQGANMANQRGRVRV